MTDPTPIKIEVSQWEVILHKQEGMNFEGESLVIPYSERFDGHSLKDVLIKIADIIGGVYDYKQ